MGGLPGPYIKFFAHQLHRDIHHMLDGFDNKTIRAQCGLGFCDEENGVCFSVIGEARGKLVEARGECPKGYWDPVFELDEEEGPAVELGLNGQTFAEMGKDKKGLISHRSRAVILMRQRLTEIYGL